MLNEIFVVNIFGKSFIESIESLCKRDQFVQGKNPNV